MDPRTQERVEQWDSRPFTGGYEELADLASNGFSGAVTAGGSWLFMLNGRVVGVVDGAIEDFETAPGTVYAAPHPSLPLLSSMQERGGETRAKYYTNETPLSEVDETLQDGAFTGYVELSEQVLSGDYYLVYYGGRRMAAAFIGNAERLLTDDEAFERADDEVGIYEVVDVEVEVTDVPGTEPTDSATDAASDPGTEPDPAAGPGSTAVAEAEPPRDATANGGPESTDGADGQPATGTAESPIVADPSPIEDVGPDGTNAAADADPRSVDSAVDADVGSDPTVADESATPSKPTDAGHGADENEPGDVDAETEVDAPDAETDVDAGAGITTSASASEPADRSARGITDANEVAGTEPDPSVDADAPSIADLDAEDAASISNLDPEEVEAAAAKLDAEEGIWTPSDESEDGEDESEDELEREFQREEQWRETRRIPSIDPERTTAASSESTASSGGGQPTTGQRGARAGSASGSQSSRSQPRQSGDASGSTPANSRSGSPAGAAAGRTGADDGTEAELESDMLEREDKIDQLTQRAEALAEEKATLEARYGELEAERDELRAKNRQLAATVERLRARIEELERAQQAGEAAGAGDGAAGASTQLSPERALAETNLFVRYESKSRPTLVSAHDGASDRSDVAANLQLERHTGFDAADVAVAGQEYETFLTETMAYRFVDWLTGTLLFEIRDTGHADSMGDLYDVIPRIDRAELNASISLEDDDTEDVPDRVTFDVVAYDKMGAPLVVATLNDSREPATREMLAEMEAAASAVSANYPDLGAAIVVTSSYFEPGALEVTEQATSGGFLSRGSKGSYVNLSRKQGYHLCLVESRSGSFHMTVPEL